MLLGFLSEVSVPNIKGFAQAIFTRIFVQLGVRVDVQPVILVLPVQLSVEVPKV
jgi:hypothetical protein